ncbi:hypothetical protein ACFY5K_36420 [Streptomyces griseofuscus]|uniref:hypothetical protein n=1 Tax=Streptomyces griseofuscus TaxID=146922 RepID=UPI00368AA6EA
MNITLYSGTDYTGESCELPIDGKTYTLAATGLPKIASVKIPAGSPMTGHPLLRLYTARPTDERDFGGEGSDFQTFEADTADTGTWAGAAYLRASTSSRIAKGTGEGARSGLSSEQRVIHDKLPH